ncbi:hypothetical protein Pmar_PMAR012055 [Perkinsus marinus ATCC 50983]|uniref:Uncharacterized protein n=1 Tax=Perkinsus marinus (strain ATCC 50983 / TXsc) TaxID=423536 RepID=C5LSC0_PERM5|nr:hypothetical protein Pmar_PMAR012055 [Perkinsus marinus ATCC 50983]EER00370.1 hypothetical protein Pmar_PMAR012055 [Perkinsus marinus ATCC 50983]|eukprot:XP_002767652.1 hypothetical protein Pmar_PMAR012055 [Perkinsus marinus ATCC 50983]
MSCAASYYFYTASTNSESMIKDTVRIPISLMLAGFRLLRFGMVLSGEHIDPIDGIPNKTLKNKALCGLNIILITRLVIIPSFLPTGIGYYDLSINYINRVFHYLDSEIRPNLGPKPIRYSLSRGGLLASIKACQEAY